MQLPAFITYLDDGLETPFNSPLLVASLALPYSLLLTSALKFPTKTYKSLLPLLTLFILYKFIVYGITYSMHYQRKTTDTLINPQENIGAIITTTILTLSLITLGSAFLLLPGLYLLIRLSLAIPIATVHGYPPRKSIMQSYKHTTGASKQIFGLFIEVLLIAFFLTVSAVAAIFVGFEFEVISWITLLVLSVLVAVIELGSQAALIELLLTQEQSD